MLDNNRKCLNKINDFFLLKALSSSSGFVIYDVIIIVFFQLKTSLINDNLFVFRFGRKFIILIIYWRILFFLLSFFLVKQIGAVYSFFKDINLTIIFVINLCLKHF